MIGITGDVRQTKSGEISLLSLSVKCPDLGLLSFCQLHSPLPVAYLPALCLSKDIAVRRRMTVLKLSLQTFRTVVSPDLMAPGRWLGVFFCNVPHYVCERENNNLTFVSSVCCTVRTVVRMWECGLVCPFRGNVLDSVEKWLSPNVILPSLLKLCLLGYQNDSTNAPKRDVVINSGGRCSCLFISEAF